MRWRWGGASPYHTIPSLPPSALQTRHIQKKNGRPALGTFPPHRFERRPAEAAAPRRGPTPGTALEGRQGVGAVSKYPTVRPPTPTLWRTEGASATPRLIEYMNSYGAYATRVDGALPSHSFTGLHLVIEAHPAGGGAGGRQDAAPPGRPRAETKGDLRWLGGGIQAENRQ